ncbi:hypothetical protein HY493_04070 [Candidatus Woesearchaeota archaeon]|nr:hypothetical protein [Candidatus Woesearchaeota archaeon]
MVFNQKLVDYVNDGLDKGFNPEHIADVLRRHGYNEPDINEAFSRIPRKNRSASWLYAAVGASAVLFVILAIAVLNPSEAKTPNALVTGNVVGVSDDARVYLNRIAQLQDQVDGQQASIDAALEQAKRAELTAAERENLLRELRVYYDDSKKEREETRQALFEFWTFLLSRNII